jgi:GH25 family lysozyme M1 (1,4-beta-N-acetylmuramidase)
VIIKASEGLSKDISFDANVDEVKKAPMSGAYHYLRSGFRWDDQANIFLSSMRHDFDFYVCDFEATGNTFSKTFSSMAWEFMKLLQKETGRKVFLYTNPNTYDVNMFPYGDWMKDYPFWVAQYYGAPDGAPRMPVTRRDWQMWQYTDRGVGKEWGCQSIAVDLNVFNGTVDDMRSYLQIATPPSEISTEEKINRLWQAHPELWRV